MSVKDVKNYYTQICQQYQEMIDNIKDLETESEKGLIEPERVERLKEQVAPIKRNYERWTYMMFLLNKPQRKQKFKKYQQQNKRLLSNLSSENSVESVLSENNETIKNME